MDSEGIWKAWMINVITKTAITTVVSSDCSETNQSGCGVFPIYFPARNVLCRMPCCPNPPRAKLDVARPGGLHPVPQSFWWSLQPGPQIPSRHGCQAPAIEPQP